MSKQDATLWREMLDYLRRKHAPICRQWFEHLEPRGLRSGLLQVHAVNEVQRNYLQKKCVAQFTEAAQSVSGALVAVQFVSQDEFGEPVEIEPAGNGSLPRGTAVAAGSASEGGLGSADHGATTQTLAATGRPVMALPTSASREPLVLPAQGEEDDQVVISPDYSFDQFITGPGNRLPYAAAVAVANQPGTAYNPLFIHGGVGLGKTHLLQAICQTIMAAAPQTRICYLSCDAFMNRFLECVQGGRMAEFRHRYRHVDVLVIDDIHFLASRERVQEEFFHTFNELYQRNKQIVLSSDSPPSEIPELEERLVSRFQWGLVAPISKPDYDTRVAIVRAKSRLRGIELADDVVQYIARKIESNARELEGAITTIQGVAALNERRIDLALAQEALGDPVSNTRSAQVTLQQIIEAVTAFYNVRLSDLQSKRRHKSVTEPRQVCMWLARRRTRFSLEEIGGYFGGRDHTTVMHSIRTVDDRCSIDNDFARQVEALESRVR